MLQTGALSAEQRSFWDENGYLILPGFYRDEQIDELDTVTDWMWHEKPRSVTVDHTVTMDRMRFCDVDGARNGNRLKLNDLFLLSETVRSTALEPRVTPMLGEILGDDPVLINTLTIDVGTAQGPHVDTLFMTPLTDDALVATWTAFEDVTVDRGPLFYYPGSHRLSPYLFSNGLQHVVDGEFPDWWAAIDRGMKELGIEREVFLPKRGDVFIWHARLVHGGSPIHDLTKSRKSLVSHFFTKTDCLNHTMPVRRCSSGGYWLNRGEQEAVARGAAVALPAPDLLGEKVWQKRRGLDAAIDFVICDDGEIRASAADGVTIGVDQGFTLRGWLLDVERMSTLVGAAVQLPDGRLITGRYGLGRPDLVAAYGTPSVKHGGYLVRVPAGTLPAGQHVLKMVAIDADQMLRETEKSLRVTVAPPLVTN